MNTRLTWVVIVLEAILFLAAVLVFMRFWIMLPVKYRIAGGAVLAVVGAIGIFRVARLMGKKG